MSDTTRKKTISQFIDITFNKLVELFKTPIYIFLVGLIVYLVAMISVEALDTHKVYKNSQMNAICPSLFSITRSARDTLIVMKAEPLCNTYILDNLK